MFQEKMNLRHAGICPHVGTKLSKMGYRGAKQESGAVCDSMPWWEMGSSDYELLPLNGEPVIWNPGPTGAFCPSVVVRNQVQLRGR